VLVIAVTAAVALLWLRTGRERNTGDRPAAPAPATVRAPNPLPAPADDAPSAEATTPPPAARLPAGWRATVGAALDAVTPPGRTLGETDRRALMDALARIRLTAGRRGRTRNPAVAAKHARLVQDADQLFRDKLGMGVGEFMARLGAPGNVEDLGAARP
jgi:hypothetical protein